MKCKIIVGLAFLGLFSLGQVQSVHAQRQYRRYSPPAGPALTPYLNFFREDTGIIGDSYNAFVVPRRQLDRDLSYMNRQQATDARQNREGIDQIREAQAAPTGSGAVFMNYSHFYSSPRNGGGGNGRRR